MERKLYKRLLIWKNLKDRKPLLLQGARQVGKTYLLKEFGKKEFNNHFIYNFELDNNLFSVFEHDLNPKRILNELSIYSGKGIDSYNDLIIFDEIQECPKALTSLKYFCEMMPELAVCCAGSLLGIIFSSESFPVGKVEFLNLYPLTFAEFLGAFDDKTSLEFLDAWNEESRIPEIVHNRIWDRLKEYFMTGGMPEVVSSYISETDNKIKAINKARELQKALTKSYNMDFAKHSGKINSMHIVSVFEDIPMQLSANIDGSVKRFQFKGVIPQKKSYAELRGPIDWLVKSGLVIKVKICNRAELPLENFCKNNIFKLYIFDIGLLGSMLDIPVSSILDYDFGITKGYFVENFVAQEFTASCDMPIYSWSERNSEIEFLSVISGMIVPVEVKSGNRTQAKSLKQYILNYTPRKAIKLSRLNMESKQDNVIKNYPLYLAGHILK